MSRPAVHKRRGQTRWSGLYGGMDNTRCANSNSATLPRTVRLWKDVTCGHCLKLRPVTDG